MGQVTLGDSRQGLASVFGEVMSVAPYWPITLLHVRAIPRCSLGIAAFAATETKAQTGQAEGPLGICFSCLARFPADSLDPFLLEVWNRSSPLTHT